METNIQPHRCSLEYHKNDRLARRRAELGDESQEAAQGFLRATDSAHGLACHQPFSTSHILPCLLVSLQRGPHVPLRKLSLSQALARADDSDSIAPCSREALNFLLIYDGDSGWFAMTNDEGSFWLRPSPETALALALRPGGIS